MKRTKLGVNILGWGLLAFVAAVSFVLRISNPAMTETQLLLAFLPEWLLLTVIGIAGIGLSCR